MGTEIGRRRGWERYGLCDDMREGEEEELSSTRDSPAGVSCGEGKGGGKRMRVQKSATRKAWTG